MMPSSPGVPSVQAFGQWLEQEEAAANSNYAASVMGNQRDRADMFAAQARCLGIARDVLRDYLSEAGQ